MNHDTDTHPIYRKQESWTMLHVLVGIFAGVATVIVVALLSNVHGCHHV